MDQDDLEIEKIKAKRKLALAIAGFITLLIFVGWIFYFKNSLKKTAEETKDQFAIFSSLKQNIGKTFNDIGNVFGEMKGKFKSAQEDMVGTSTATTTQIK